MASGIGVSTTRAVNIALRTMHIGVTSALFGGHVFGIGRERLLVWLYLSIATGAALMVVEAYPHWRWIFEGRAAMLGAKLVLLCLVPWLWEYRVGLLALVIVIGSVASHVPRRYRYYSLVERRVVEHGK